MARKPLPSVAPTERVTRSDRARPRRRILLAVLAAAALAVAMSGCVIFKSVSSSQLDVIGNVQITTTACASDTASDHTGYSPTDSACQGSSHGGNINASAGDLTTGTPTLHHVTTGLKTDTTTTDPSFSFTVNSGSDRLLVVKLGENSATDNIAGVTYGGTALTALTEFVPGASRFVDHVFYLKNPPTGTAPVVVDITAGVKVTAAMEQYNGVNQTTTFGTVATNSNTGSTAPTVSVTGASGDLITDSLVVVSNTTIPTVATSPQTEDYEINTGATTTDIVAAGSHQTAAGTSTTMAHTLSASRAWSTVGFAIKPSQVGMQLKLAYRIPTAITAPSTITSTDPSGGSAITFTQNSDYTTQLTSLAAPGSGKKWVGYLSDFQSYTTAGHQYFTVAPQFALPQGSDGSPYQGPFNYRVVVGFRGVDQSTTGSTSSRAVTCGAGTAYAVYADGSSTAGQQGVCIDDPSSSTLTSDLSQNTRDLGVMPGSAAALAGSTASVPFTLRWRGNGCFCAADPITASTNIPGATATPSTSTVGFGSADFDTAVNVSVPIPPGTAAGTYNVTLFAPFTSPQTRQGTATLTVGEAFGFNPSPALPSLGSISLNAQAQTKNATMSNFGVIDSPGSSDAGWNVTVVGDTSGGKPGLFKQYCPGPGACGSDSAGQYVSGGFSLLANSLTLNTSSGSWSGGTGTAPSFNCNAGGCGVDAATATKIASAPNGGGNSLWSATGFSSSSLTLLTPSTLRALPASEVYHLDAVWTLNSGP